MRALSTVILAIFVVSTILETEVALAKKPSRSRPVASSSSRRPRPSAGGKKPRPSAGRPPSSKRRVYEEEEEEEEAEEEDFGFPEELDEEEDGMADEEEEEMPPPRSRKPQSRKSSTTARDTAIHRSSARKRGGTRPAPRGRREEDEDSDDFRGPPPKSRAGGAKKRPPPGRGGPPPGRGRGGRGPGGRVVPYSRSPPQPGYGATFVKGLSAIRNSLPDPSTVRDVAASSLSAARQTTSSLSANFYREVKGLTSSELEQVMLKATRPDDGAVKGKHVERLVGVTYQISSRYDIYDAVLRKLWSKMAEKDWRTTMKALYILHRFSADGAPEHAAALKARLRELRRTRDPKRKDKYFNSKQLLSGDANPENIKFRAFMSRYAHYVLLRTQCFGGMFDEISALPKPDKKKPPKPITATCLRAEHLDAAAMLLKAGIACQLKEGEECENTALSAERVASDMIGLTTAVAIALNRALKNDDLNGADPALLKRWTVLYSEELLPKTKAMVKKTSPKLDAYGLFLPSRMGTTVSPDLIEKGLSLEGKADDSPRKDTEMEKPAATQDDAETEVEPEDEDAEEDIKDSAEKRDAEAEEIEDNAIGNEEDLEDEYEYEEEEYYDDEEE